MKKGTVGLLIALTLRCGVAALGARGLSPLITVSGYAGQDVDLLTTGQMVEQELGTGETRRHRMSAKSGEYISLLIEPRGIELKLLLSSSDGAQVAQVESVVEGEGGRTLSLIAKVAGDYQLVVSPAGRDEAHGSYQLKVTEWRIATTQDVSRVAAERVIEEAERLDNLRQMEQSRKAIEKFEEALTLWRAAGDRRGEAVTYQKLSSVWRRLSDYQKALDRLGPALQFWRETGDRNGEAFVLNEFGEIYIEMSEYQKALDFFNQALNLHTGNRSLEASLLNNIGAVYRRTGDNRKALDYYRRSFVLMQATGNRRDGVTVLNNIGVASNSLGEYQQALECYEQAVSIWRALGDNDGEGMSLHNIAAVYSNLGDHQQAINTFRQAAHLRGAAGNRAGAALSLLNLGNAYSQAGELDQSHEGHNQALTIFRAINDRAGEGMALEGIGVAYGRTGDHQQALDYFTMALQLHRAVGNRNNESNTLHNMARSWYEMGDYQKARDYSQQALQLRRETGNRRGEAQTLLELARAESRLGNLAVALTRIEAAIEIVELLRTKVASTELRAIYQATNQDYYDFYIDLLMRLQRDRPSEGYSARALQVSERARSRSLLDLLIDTQANLRQGADATLLEREQTLIYQINDKDTKRRQLLSRKRDEAAITSVEKELEELLTQYRAVQSEIRARSPRYAALTQPQTLSLKEIREQLLDNETLLLEYKLGRERSYLWAVTFETFRSLELPARAEIGKAARQVNELIRASRGQYIADETPQQKSQRLARAKADYSLAAAALSQMLLGPVSDLLGKKRLVIVGDGALQYTPFAALPTPEMNRRREGETERRRVIPSFSPSLRLSIPLIVDHEVVSLPSASVLAVLRQEKRERIPASNSVAVLADPVFDVNDARLSTKGDTIGMKEKQVNVTSSKYGSLERSERDAGISEFRRLKYSRDEALAIGGLAPADQALVAVDFRASRATATSPDMSRYRIVHFATHGLLNTQHPELSGLVLSLVDERGAAQDGFLRLHEVYSLKLNADLVVLSGCETALGKEIRGEGLIGLTRGFMYAGAGRIVASLWNVDDQATTNLMKLFYERMLKDGLRPAAALRAAQIAMWKTDPDAVPYRWGAFILQGDWR